MALAVVMAARKLKNYFLAHSIIVRTDQPIKQLLARPDMIERMLKCSLKLVEFDISYESRKALKAQGSGAGIILENSGRVLIEVSLGLAFPTTNNQAEYKAFLAGLRLTEDMKDEEIKIYTDSQLVASQVSGEYQTKDERLSEYLALIKEKLARFKESKVKHVPREHNAKTDVLSKLASTRRKKGGNQSLIQETLSKPSIEKTPEVLLICDIDNNSWMTPVFHFLSSGELPDDKKEAAKIKRRACAYHIGRRSLARKALRAGFYWPTMQADAKEHVKKCDKCQRHGDMHLAPPSEIRSLSSPWPFAWWGMYILGSFPTAPGQNKYLIVAVDYFTKWIEAEPLAKISAKFQDFLAKIGTTQHFTSVEHPQTNGQAEAANRVILRGLKRRLGEAKKKWIEELHSVLWSYRTTPHSTTGETPFRLTYGIEAVIPVETGASSHRTEAPVDDELNSEMLREELDLLEELRDGAALREALIKQKIATRHDKKKTSTGKNSLDFGTPKNLNSITVEICANDVPLNAGCVFDKEKHAFTTEECLGTGTNLKGKKQGL
ncbi:hypothetical protein A2U01_0002459, partial [Trifolium medium]|nr:hypothetical protein [Trifolium medium]